MVDSNLESGKHFLPSPCYAWTCSKTDIFWLSCKCYMQLNWLYFKNLWVAASAKLEPWWCTMHIHKKYICFPKHRINAMHDINKYMSALAGLPDNPSWCGNIWIFNKHTHLVRFLISLARLLLPSEIIMVTNRYKSHSVIQRVGREQEICPFTTI